MDIQPIWTPDLYRAMLFTYVLTVFVKSLFQSAMRLCTSLNRTNSNRRPH